MNGDENMDDVAVLAVPCDNVFIVSREQGEKILRECESRKLSESEKKEVIARGRELRRKPDKR